MSPLELRRPDDPIRAAIWQAWARRRGLELRYVDESDLAEWHRRQATAEREYPRSCVNGHTITGPEDEYRKLTRKGSGKYRMICAHCDRARKLKSKAAAA